MCEICDKCKDGTIGEYIAELRADAIEAKREATSLLKVLDKKAIRLEPGRHDLQADDIGYLVVEGGTVNFWSEGVRLTTVTGKDKVEGANTICNVESS